MKQKLTTAKGVAACAKHPRESAAFATFSEHSAASTAPSGIYTACASLSEHSGTEGLLSVGLKIPAMYADISGESSKLAISLWRLVTDLVALDSSIVAWKGSNVTAEVWHGSGRLAVTWQGSGSITVTGWNSGITAMSWQRWADSIVSGLHCGRHYWWVRCCFHHYGCVEL